MKTSKKVEPIKSSQQLRVAEKAKRSRDSRFFNSKKAQSWLDSARQRKVPSMLFSEFWHENELCILFADTNLGKSILAVQLADSLSKAKPIPHFKLETTSKRKVLYFDFELTDKQFEARYSYKYTNHYQFDDFFIRCEINQDAKIPKNVKFEDYLVSQLEECIIEHNANIVIIDNITYLKDEIEKTKDALQLMKLLKKLKNKYNLSMLILAHTPKRDLSKAITRNDLQGSKVLINFCDSAFAIGESTKGKEIRYLKQIKARDTEIVYDAKNVVVCKIFKPDNFLRFEFLGTSSEEEHLKNTITQEQLRDNAISLRKEGLSLREIAKKLNVSHMKVSRLLRYSNNNN